MGGKKYFGHFGSAPPNDYGWEHFQEMSAVGFEELPVEIDGTSCFVNWNKYSTGVWSKEEKNREV